MYVFRCIYYMYTYDIHVYKYPYVYAREFTYIYIHAIRKHKLYITTHVMETKQREILDTVYTFNSALKQVYQIANQRSDRRMHPTIHSIIVLYQRKVNKFVI